MSTPEIWGVTPDVWSWQQTVQEVMDAFADGITHVIVRERTSRFEDRLRIMHALLDLGLPLNRVLLRLDPQDPTPPQEWSLHLADGLAAPDGPRPLVSAAVHTRAGTRTDVDRLLVSPFASPTSKPATGPLLGASGLVQFCVQPVPVVALGGISSTNAAAAIATGAAGVAAIGSIFLHGRAERRALVTAVTEQNRPHKQSAPR